METNNFKHKLQCAFKENGLIDLLDQTSAERLYQLYNSLVETNKITNLTAVTDEGGVILKHFVDSATVCEHIPHQANVIDIGCGAGFPSLPIAILRQDASVTSLDSTGKKITFATNFANNINLANSIAVCARAEEYVADHREIYDVCVSRAVARLNVLAELCIPFIKTGGLFIAMKSNKGSEEYAEAETGIKKLGATLIDSKTFSLTFNKETIEREIYVFQKTKSTPKEFPRKYAQITKRPL